MVPGYFLLSGSGTDPLDLGQRTQDFPGPIICQGIAAAFPSARARLASALNSFHSSMAAKACHTACSSFSCQGELPAPCSIDSNKSSRCDNLGEPRALPPGGNNTESHQSCTNKNVCCWLQMFEHWVPSWWHGVGGWE